VYPSGIKKFQIQYFLQGNRKRMEFGKYGKQLGFYSLSQASKAKEQDKEEES